MNGSRHEVEAGQIIGERQASSSLRAASPLTSLSSDRFGILQIEVDSLSVDQHKTGIDQLLACKVVLFVSAKRCKGEDELYGLYTLFPHSPEVLKSIPSKFAPALKQESTGRIRCATC